MRPSTFRTLSYLAASLLLLALFEACSSTDNSAVEGPLGPPSVVIASSPEARCGGLVAVVLEISNWTLKPPGLCEATPKCGQVRVRLSNSGEATVLAMKVSASAGVDLEPKTPLPSGGYTVEADLIDDAGEVFPSADASNSLTFDLKPATDCDAGMPGAAGAGGAAAGEGGSGGEGGFGRMPDLGEGGSGGVAAGAGGA